MYRKYTFTYYFLYINAQKYIINIFNNQKVKFSTSWSDIRAIQNGHRTSQYNTKSDVFYLIIHFSILMYECLITWLVYELSITINIIKLLFEGTNTYYTTTT